jgi:hypothetical protein
MTDHFGDAVPPALAEMLRKTKTVAHVEAIVGPMSPPVHNLVKAAFKAANSDKRQYRPDQTVANAMGLARLTQLLQIVGNTLMAEVESASARDKPTTG